MPKILLKNTYHCTLQPNEFLQPSPQPVLVSLISPLHRRRLCRFCIPVNGRGKCEAMHSLHVDDLCYRGVFIA
jgi:hypothetical protein